MSYSFRRYKDSLWEPLESSYSNRYKSIGYDYQKNFEEYAVYSVYTKFEKYNIEDSRGYIHDKYFFETFKKTIANAITNNTKYTNYFFDIIEITFNYDEVRNLYSNPLLLTLVAKEKDHLVQLTQILYEEGIINKSSIVECLELVSQSTNIYSPSISQYNIDLSKSKSYLINIKPEYFYKIHIYGIKDVGKIRLDGRSLEIITVDSVRLDGGLEVPAGSKAEMSIEGLDLDKIISFYHLNSGEFKQNIINLLQSCNQLKNKYIEILNITRINYIDLGYTTNPRSMDVVVKDEEDIKIITDILEKNKYIEKNHIGYYEVKKIDQFEKEDIIPFDTISKYYDGDPREHARQRYLEETAEALGCGYEEVYEYELYDEY